MKFNFEQFCTDHGIAISPPGHKHSRAGWINVECPLCSGNFGYHLGLDKENDYFRCWRCGFHKHIEVIQSLLDCDRQEAKHKFYKYRGEESRPVQKKIKQKSKVGTADIPLPPGTDFMTHQHKQYLIDRKFDPDRLEQIWDLKGTGNIGAYKFRIIAPIFFEGHLVSYQGRDITNTSSIRYKACEKEKEARDHKHCLYGLNKVSGDSVVVVEGITDVWRLGPGAVATFGIQVLLPQINLLRQFKNKYILFDSADPQAIAEATKLANCLSIFPGHVEVIEISSDDPAELEQEEADELMKELLSK